MYEEYTGKIAVENLRPSWFIFSDGFKRPRGCRSSSAAWTSWLAAVGLVTASPLMGVVALLMKADSRGPVFYHQERVGQHGRVFTVHKFRSMRITPRPAPARSGQRRRPADHADSAVFSAAPGSTSCRNSGTS